MLFNRLLTALGLLAVSVQAAPTPQADASAASDYWVASIKRQGVAAFGNADYQIFRNVKDFGAKGDGTTDDTEAINAAISTGNRCGLGCDSQTTTPALVYFPPGTYLVSKPIIQYYYTQLVGDALDLPVLKASADFTGMAVIDSDPYTDTGENWYTNQNNFFRSIRNFVIDLTGMPPTSGTGIHWQVGQATSLQNIRFEMVRGGDNNVQQGIFMDNGSGGFMSDLVFNGGNYGMFLGNQQFTTRNLTFNGCNTAIFMNWNWAWTFKSITVNDCGVALNMSNNPPEMTVGSVMILDSSISTTRESIVTAWTQNSNPIGGGVLVLDNVDFTGSQVAVAHIDGSTVLEGGSVVDSWVQGNTYTPPGTSGAQKRHVTESLSEGEDACPAPEVVTVTSTTMVPAGASAETAAPAPSPADGSAGTGLQSVESVASTATANAGVSSASVQEIASGGNAASVTTTSVASAAETSVASSSTSATRIFPTNKVAACSSTPTVEKARTQGAVQRPPKPSGLLDGNGRILERTRPFYNDVPASSFVSVKDAGAKGDGKTDDTAAIQKVFDSVTSDQIVYFDHGAYLITSTIKVPKNIKITGEIWPLLMATGDAFQDEENPIPMLQIGEPGDVGDVEISDLVLETKGPAPGAILMQWNVAGSSPGSAGMWDVHFRVGGSAGTELQSDKCAKTPDVTTNPDPQCLGAFMLFHVTEQASVYVENSWFWVSDHELDLEDHNQINIYNGRGVLIESQNPVWLYGTGSEHNQLYNYQIQNAKNVFMGLIQTETPYYQANPNALVPFKPQSKWNDPDFSTCTTDGCRKAWGLRVLGSSDVFIYGGGLYSFFENYGQTCLDTESCQENMIEVDCSQVTMFGMSTKASVNMFTSSSGEALVLQEDNRSNFCSTVALFQQ
ncbi:hypothetical protein VTN49DRAFT_2804 [Thermomyces lanuginosus]|uniref:uncharacterized protein n=1 Tax=Thermomyces lanuginosus TaxID=5541 RepID=UPI003744617F